MSIEIVHPEGQKDLTREEKLFMKKQSLRMSMGWTEEELEDKLDEVKHFFTAHKKHILRGETCKGIYDQHDRDTYLDKQRKGISIWDEFHKT